MPPQASPDRPRRRHADRAALWACGTPPDTQSTTAGPTASPSPGLPHSSLFVRFAFSVAIGFVFLSAILNNFFAMYRCVDVDNAG